MKLVTGLVALFFLFTTASPSNAATVKYKNCKALNAVYASGVAKVGAVDTKKVKGKKVARQLMTQNFTKRTKV